MGEIKPINENMPKDLSYELKQQETLNSLKIGNTDLNGNKIKKIYARGDEHVIYEIEDSAAIDSLKVVIYTKAEENMVPIDNFQSIKDCFDSLKSVLYKSGADTSYKQRAASAIVTAIHGKVAEAKEILKNIEEDAQNDYRHRIYGRLCYLFGSILVTVVLGIASLSVYILRNTAFISENSELSLILYSICYAALGGFFSVSLKAKEVFTLRTIHYWMYAIYGAERMFVSIVAGIATYTLMSSGLIFPSLNPHSSTVYALLAICFLSGFSETLIPNSLNKLEKSTQK